MHEAIANLLDSWEQELGTERFDQPWATLQQLTGEMTPLPDRSRIRLDEE